METHTVILSYDGITRHYRCDSYFDAVILADALGRVYGGAAVETWEISATPRQV